jgi:hypothetical protein
MSDPVFKNEMTSLFHVAVADSSAKDIINQKVNNNETLETFVFLPSFEADGE